MGSPMSGGFYSLLQRIKEEEDRKAAEGTDRPELGRGGPWGNPFDLLPTPSGPWGGGFGSDPEPIVPRQPTGTTAPETPRAGGLAPDLAPNTFDYYSPQSIEDQYAQFLFRPTTVGQPTDEAEDAPPYSGPGEASRNGITAVKDPVTGKVTFVTQNLLGVKDGYAPSTEIGYQGGLNALAGRALKPGTPALPQEGEAVLASMKRTAVPDFKAPEDVTQLENWGEYMQGVDEGRLQRELFRARQGQALQATEIDPRRREEAGLMEQAAKAHLLGSEGEQAQATADWTRARAELMRDPAADAMKRGRANAEQILGFRARLTEQAKAEIDPSRVDEAANQLFLQKKAPSLAEARKRIEQRLIDAKVQEMIAGNPELQRYFIQQTGEVGGYGGAQ